MVIDLGQPLLMGNDHDPVPEPGNEEVAEHVKRGHLTRLGLIIMIPCN